MKRPTSWGMLTICSTFAEFSLTGETGPRMARSIPPISVIRAANGSTRMATAEVETRGPFKGPRAYDHTGLPLHFDNQSTFRERFFLDKSDPNLFHDEITVVDHGLTRPWSVDKTFRRNQNPRPRWAEASCNEGNVNIV